VLDGLRTARASYLNGEDLSVKETPFGWLLRAASFSRAFTADRNQRWRAAESHSCGRVRQEFWALPRNRT